MKIYLRCREEVITSASTQPSTMKRSSPVRTADIKSGHSAKSKSKSPTSYS